MGKSSNPTFAGDKEFEKIHLKEKFSYGLGDVACNVVYALTTSLLIYFYTNVVGISAAMIGTIMLFSRFFDGISDVLIGHLVDRTHSKHGKSRAWILWMMIPYGIAAILLFTVPPATPIVKGIYVFITYNFNSVFWANFLTMKKHYSAYEFFVYYTAFSSLRLRKSNACHSASGQKTSPGESRGMQ